MLLHDSRRDARLSSADELVPLEEQNRSLWHRAQIEEGTGLLERALRLSRIGPYQLQAAIAALHAEADTPERTDWKQIAALYRQLERIHPSPIVALNSAVALAMSDGLENGLAAVEKLGGGGDLDSYYLYHAARADLLRRLDRHEAAVKAYERAISLTANAIERRYLRRRIAELNSSR
jgi:RNA polymerase sigma-70 factor (ECF subfamily)